MSARRALIVATGAYRDEKFRELRAPAADADRLVRVLRDPAVGDFEVETALDEEESVLRRRISRFFVKSERDDVLLLHVSGHGVKDAHGGLYLAATDTEIDLLDATALSARWLDEQISRSPSRRKLLLLDCCFSGKFPFNATARAGDTIDVHERFQGRGRAVITASNAMEYAYEGDELSGEGQPSYFTAALVEALETGEADRDQDQWISVDELYDFIFDRVKDRSSAKQTPTKQIALEGALYVARSHFKLPVKPAKLDEQLLILTEHPVAGARLGAIDELERMMSSANAGVVLAARLTLERMVDDDSRRVAERATQALARVEQRDAEERAQRDAEERARQDAEERDQRDAEERAQRDAEERAQRDAEERAQRDAEEAGAARREERAQRAAGQSESHESAVRSADDGAPGETAAGGRVGERSVVREWLYRHRAVAVALIATLLISVAVVTVVALGASSQSTGSFHCTVGAGADCTTFAGSGNVTLGKVKLPVPATLVWQCRSCGPTGIQISSDPTRTPAISVASRATDGQKNVRAATYHDVKVKTNGRFTITFSPD
jgi:Caspase domain